MIKNFLLFCLSFALFVSALEFSLKLIGPDDENVFSLDNELIFKPIPGRKFRYVRFLENGGGVIESGFNSLGIRGREFDAFQFDGVRVVVYGDSIIQASYTQLEKTFVYQLEKRLQNELNGDVQVLNAGVNGYGPDQYLIRLRNDLPILNPDLVIVAIFADNDFGDLIRNKIFRIDMNGQLARHDFVVDEEVKQRYQKRENLNRAFALQKAFIDPTIIKRDLRILVERRIGISNFLFQDVPIETAFRTDPRVPWIERWLDRGRNEFHEYIVEKDPVVRLDNIRSDHYDADMSLFPRAWSSRYKVDLMKLVLSEMARLLRKHQIPMMILIIPSPVDVCEGYDWQVDPNQFPAYDRQTLTQSIERIAKQSDIHYFNLYRHFSGANCNNLYYHFGNNHWTDEGQAKAARLVSDTIREKRFLDSGR